MVQNVGVTVEIGSISVFVQKLGPISTFGFVADNQPEFAFPRSAEVGQCRQSGMVANVRLAVEIASPSLFVHKLFLLPVSWPKC